MRDLILDRVRDTVWRYHLAGPGDRVIIGLSGGPDSVALSHLLPAVAHEFGAVVVGLAHLNHQLRPSADADEQFCRDLASRLSLPIDVERADVRAAARQARTSLEDGARRVRYAFLRRAAARLDATRIAVAHHRHDQAETVLLRLLRGAGTTGLAAIRPRNASGVIRPFLEVSRLDIEALIAEEGWSFRVDPTNADVTIPRNRIRHELLPYLAQHFGGPVGSSGEGIGANVRTRAGRGRGARRERDGIVDILARQATLAREDAEWLDQIATETARSLVLEDMGSVTVAIAPLLALPPAICRRVLRLALSRSAGERFLGFAHVDAVLALVRDPAGPSDRNPQPAVGTIGMVGTGTEAAIGKKGSPRRKAVIDLPGQRVKRIKGLLYLTPLPSDPGRAGQRRGRPKQGRTRPRLVVT
jgi:tRNA(Ile)-lysidine synthase